MNIKKISLLFFLATLFFISCGVPKNFQHALYLQDSVTEAEKVINDTQIIILPGDRLNISISAINKTAAEDFNMASSGTSSGATAAVTGYLVDSAGNIQLLQLGKLHVAGTTTQWISDTIQRQLESYIKGAIVTVSISNFKVNMLGEIGKPGVLAVPDSKLNILEAISQSGDLTLYGRRDNILVIRTVNGKREFGRLDISSNKIFESPYYNLKQNDIVYVESDKAKFLANDAGTTRTVRSFGFAVTILTTLILLVNLFNKN